MPTLAEGLLYYIVFLASTTLHEAAHAWAALRLGDRTAYDGGQVTLSPIPHILREPLGTVIVPLLSLIVSGSMFGWASVPYNRQWAYDHPRSSALMSAAGPAANLLLVVVSGLLMRAGLTAGLFVAPDSLGYARVVEATMMSGVPLLALVLSVSFSMNLLLLIFNLIPLPPLDGSGIIPLFLERTQAQRYLDLLHGSQFAFIGILVAWRLFDLIYDPLHIRVINLLFSEIAHYR
jgi:Zn-dependent protease